MAKKLDVKILNCGSLFLFHLRTTKAKVFVSQKVDTTSAQWLGPNLAVDARYAEDLAIAMKENGLVLA